jgi:hypothetical protein
MKESGLDLRTDLILRLSVIILLFLKSGQKFSMKIPSLLMPVLKRLLNGFTMPFDSWQSLFTEGRQFAEIILNIPLNHEFIEEYLVTLVPCRNILRPNLTLVASL